MFNKLNRKASRARRHVRLRKKLEGTAERPRLSVYRSLKHFHVQLVDDIAGKIADLSGAGIAFDRYPGMEQDELGVWTEPGSGAQVAWFKDPETGTHSASVKCRNAAKVPSRDWWFSAAPDDARRHAWPEPVLTFAGHAICQTAIFDARKKRCRPVRSPFELYSRRTSSLVYCSTGTPG